ncbi:hypothetical protein FQR65_LT15353 [Abscondita terminalis]|nr:hypothetical protein FQR65_LT15353 [Abscondita terminalis]
MDINTADAGENIFAQPFAIPNAVILPLVSDIPPDVTPLANGPQTGNIALANPEVEGIANEIGIKIIKLITMNKYGFIPCIPFAAPLIAPCIPVSLINAVNTNHITNLHAKPSENPTIVSPAPEFDADAAVWITNGSNVAARGPTPTPNKIVIIAVILSNPLANISGIITM